MADSLGYVLLEMLLLLRKLSLYPSQNVSGPTANIRTVLWNFKGHVQWKYSQVKMQVTATGLIGLVTCFHIPLFLWNPFHQASRASQSINQCQSCLSHVCPFTFYETVKKHLFLLQNNVMDISVYTSQIWFSPNVSFLSDPGPIYTWTCPYYLPQCLARLSWCDPSLWRC